MPQVGKALVTVDMLLAEMDLDMLGRKPGTLVAMVDMEVSVTDQRMLEQADMVLLAPDLVPHKAIFSMYPCYQPKQQDKRHHCIFMCLDKVQTASQ